MTDHPGTSTGTPRAAHPLLTRRDPAPALPGRDRAQRLRIRLSSGIGLVIAALVLAVAPAAAQDGWSGFRDIGGTFPAAAPVTAVSRNPKQIDLFVTGLDGHVYTSSYTKGSDWTGIGNQWTDIGGVFAPAAPIAAVARNPKQIDLFVMGLDGHVYTSFSANGGPWSGAGDPWLDIGGVFPPGASLAVVSRNPNQMDVFVVGNDGHVYTSWYIDGNAWSGIGDTWLDIGGVFPSGAPLSVVSRNPNQMDVFIIGLDGHVYTSWYIDGSDWSGIGDTWRDIGGVFRLAAPVTAISRNPNQIDLFVTGQQGDVYTSWYVDGSDWSGIGDQWRDIGGVFPNAAPIAAVAQNPNRMDLFVTGNDGLVYTSSYQDGSDWTGLGNQWAAVGGTFPWAAPLAALNRTDDRLDVFVTGNDGVVYTATSPWSDDTGVQPTPEPNDGTATPVRVVKAVDLYDAPGGDGTPIGTLRKGTKGVTLVEPCQDDWCHVTWPAGEGWVYDGADYDSLRP